MVAGNSIYLRTDGLSEGEDLTFCKTDEVGFMFLNENMKKILEDVLQMVENWWNYLIFDIFQTACCVVVRKIKNIEESYRKNKKTFNSFLCIFFFNDRYHKRYMLKKHRILWYREITLLQVITGYSLTRGIKSNYTAGYAGVYIPRHIYMSFVIF